MKKWLLVVALIILIGYAAMNKPHEPSQEVTMEESTSHIEGDQEIRTIKVAKSQVYTGDLILVNNDHPVHEEGIAPDILSLHQQQEWLNRFVLLDNSIRLSHRIAGIFAELTEEAEGEGVNHFMISSGYRDLTEQAELYREKGADYALSPGHSEHNIGLSLDIGSTLEGIDQAPEGRWLKENAWNYGFVLRYPKDKTEITGIKYEPWHFRYVGLPHSLIMKEKNMVLEEYQDYLKNQKGIQVTVNNKKYEIIYTAVTKNTKVRVPAGHPFTISGNNIDGVVVTVSLSEKESHGSAE